MSSIPPTSPPSVIRPPSPPPFPQEASSSLSSGISSSRVPLDMSSDSPLVPIDALASSDRPASRRARSSSNGTSASTSHATFEPSSVPSTPQNVPHRFWRPTPNVPFRVSQRHQLHRVTNHGDEEDHNQWLSEDEGLQGVGPSIGRRRRRKTSHRGGSGDDGDRQDRRNPGTNTVRERSRVEEGKEAGTEAAIEAIRRNPSASRPTIRRVQSLDPPPAPVAGPSSIPLTEQQGVSPPRIENLVPATISSALAIGLGLSNITQSVNPAPSVVSIEGIEERMSDSVPDFSSGRGGDGIGGFGLPAATVVDKHEDGLKRRERQDDLLGKLQRILGW